MWEPEGPRKVPQGLPWEIVFHHVVPAAHFDRNAAIPVTDLVH
jgi:hypothetical protein